MTFFLFHNQKAKVLTRMETVVQLELEDFEWGLKGLLKVSYKDCLMIFMVYVISILDVEDCKFELWLKGIELGYDKVLQR